MKSSQPDSPVNEHPARLGADSNTGLLPGVAASPQRGGSTIQEAGMGPIRTAIWINYLTRRRALIHGSEGDKQTSVSDILPLLTETAGGQKFCLMDTDSL